MNNKLSTGHQKMMDYIKNGDDAQTALDKARGQYGRVEDAVRLVDPRKE